MTEKLRSIQVLRAVAALAVLSSHTAGASGGAAGVDLFFVISGYIIASVAPGRQPREFIEDRLWRIYPTYWLCASPWLLAALIIRPRFDVFMSSLTLWPLWGSHYSIPLLQPAWSLTYEMLFYAAAAGALLLRSWKPLAAIFCGLAIANFMHPTGLTAFAGNPIIIEFLAGALLTRVRLCPWLGIPALLSAAVLLALSPPLSQIVTGLFSEPVIPRLLWWGVPAILVFYAARANEWLFQGRVWDPLVAIGDASYSLYLIQWTVIFASKLNPLAEVALSSGLAILAYRTIERPLLLARKLRRQRQLYFRYSPTLFVDDVGVPNGLGGPLA